MTTAPDDLDELSQQLAAEIEAAMPYVTEQLAGAMEELQQLTDELLPLPWDEAP